MHKIRFSYNSPQLKRRYGFHHALREKDCIGIKELTVKLKEMNKYVQMHSTNLMIKLEKILYRRIAKC